MKKTDSFVRIVPLEMFRIGAMLLVGKEVDDLKHGFLKVCMGVKWPQGRSCEEMFGLVASKIKEADTCAGCAFEIDACGDKFIYLKKFDRLTLIHEIVHVVDMMICDLGLDNRCPSEDRAYMVEYLFGEFSNERGGRHD